MTERPLAAIDIGTNSFHMVVARVGEVSVAGEFIGPAFEVVAREKEMVRLGSGSGDMKELSGDAIERGVVALERLVKIAAIHDADVVAVATSAVREAENADVFLDRAREEAGVVVDVISGVEEARLIHLGVLQAVPVFDQRVVVIDIGGGSTEILVGERGETLAAGSLKLGAIRLTRRFFRGERLHPGAVESCRRHVRSVLAPMVRDVERVGYGVAVASSGTAETVASVVNAQRGAAPPRTFNGFVMTRDEIGAAVGALIAAGSVEERRSMAGMDPSRADIILAGAIILQSIIDESRIDSLVFSDFALREGLLLDTFRRSVPELDRELQVSSRNSVEALMTRLDDDPAHSRHVAHLALQLFDGLKETLGVDDDQRFMLEAAALLSNVGLSISHSKHHLHSYYIIKHADMPGFRERDVELIAQIARYHRKSKPKNSHEAYAALDESEKHIVRSLASILRIAIGLDRSHDGRVTHVDVKKKGSRIGIVTRARNGEDLNLNLYSARERADLLCDLTGSVIDVA